MVKGDNVLRPSILVNGERRTVQAGDNALLVIDYGGVQHHFVHFLMKQEAALLFVARRLAGLAAGG